MSGAKHPIPLDAFTACLGAILTLLSVVLSYVLSYVFLLFY